MRPANISRAIALHHCPDLDPAGQEVSLSGLLQVADAVAHALDLSGDDLEAVPAIEPGVWKLLGLRPDDALRIFAFVEAGTREMSEILQR